jgi:hypothetical protein
VRIEIFSNRRVLCEAAIELPLSMGAAWGQLRDFRNSARHDPFHSHICIEGDVPRAGANLKIEHRYLFARTLRVGRILQWNERSGFAFSDLCERDFNRAFPHVLSYQLERRTETSCVLRIRVGGRWTAPTPRWVGKVWLWWVFSHVVRTVRNQLLAFAVLQASRKKE